MTAPGVTALVVSAGVLVVLAACLAYWSRDAKQRRRLARLKGQQ